MARMFSESGERPVVVRMAADRDPVDRTFKLWQLWRRSIATGNRRRSRLFDLFMAALLALNPLGRREEAMDRIREANKKK